MLTQRRLACLQIHEALVVLGVEFYPSKDGANDVRPDLGRARPHGHLLTPPRTAGRLHGVENRRFFLA